MTPGRKPKPTALKVLQGNPGKRKLNKREAKLPAGLVDPPGFLDPAGVELWNELGPDLVGAGILTVADAPAFAKLCQAHALYLRAMELIPRDENGSKLLTYVIRDKDGQAKCVQTHPAVNEVNRQFDKFKSMCVEFGLTPSSRGRIEVPKASRDEDDAWGVFG